MHHIRCIDKINHVETGRLNPSLLTSVPPPLAHVHYKIGRIIFTCVSSWCEGSAGSQVRVGSFASSMISADGGLQSHRLWSVLHTTPVQLVQLWVWVLQRLHLVHAALEAEMMEHVLLVGGRLCASWECPFRVAYFPASPAFFFLCFCSCLLFFLWTLKSFVLRVKLLSPHPNYAFGQQRRRCSLPIILRDGFSLWLISAHRLWGVFISTSGEVNRVCPQTNTPYFLLQPLDMFVVFPLRLSVIQLADVNTVHCDSTWKSRQQFKLTIYLEVETHPKVLVNLFKVQLWPLNP